MRLTPSLLFLTACGQLGPFADFYDDTGFDDTGFDTGPVDTGPVDTGPTDTGPTDTGTPPPPPPPTVEGTYTGTFTLEVLAWGFLPNVCTSPVSISATSSAISGSYGCTFDIPPLSLLGALEGTITGSVSSSTLTAPYGTMIPSGLTGELFVFDALSGGFTGGNRLALTESGVVDLEDLGEFPYTVSFQLTK